MQTHDIKRNKHNRRSRIVGRGGRRGKTSGRGTKGQKARAGRKIRPALRDIIKKLPKKRGYRFATVSSKPFAVSLSKFARLKEDIVTPTSLLSSGLIRKSGGRLPRVKIVGAADLNRAFKISGCLISAGARKKIEDAGGEVK